MATSELDTQSTTNKESLIKEHGYWLELGLIGHRQTNKCDRSVYVNKTNPQKNERRPPTPSSPGSAMKGAVVGGNEQPDGSGKRGIHGGERAAGREEGIWNGEPGYEMARQRHVVFERR